MRRRLAFGSAILLALGTIALLSALTWWALVFGVILRAGVLSLREASICFLDSSGLCQAVAVMCLRDHPLNIRTYSPELFWLSLALLAPGVIAAFIVAMDASGGHPKSAGS